jgi:hypothetical protein
MTIGWAKRHGGYSGGKTRLAGAFLGFFALLPYFFLPLVYYNHLTQFSFPAAYGDPRAGPPLAVSQPEKPHRPWHDSNSCPICRTTQTFEDGGFLSSCPVAEQPGMTGIFSDSDHSPGIARLELLISRIRAPPISSLALPII